MAGEREWKIEFIAYFDVKDIPYKKLMLQTSLLRLGYSDKR
jgi:hypothetical protein